MFNSLFSGGLVPLLALFIISIGISSAYGGEYCAAIRGNGENVGAHWASLSRLVEENGMPTAMAGGSSATVSMFFLDNISGNPATKGEKDPIKKRKKEALLLKSLNEFISEMAKTEEVASVFAMKEQLSKPDSSLALELQKIASGTGPVSAKQLSSAIGKFFPLINPEVSRGLIKNPAFFKEEIKDSAGNYGKFDAVNSKNLFVRPGLVDFKEIALNLGNIADFYKGNTDPETQAELAKFTNDCAEQSYKRQWNDSANENCRSQFSKIARSYLQKGNFQNKAIFEPTGSNIKSIPTTAVVKGEAVNRFNQMRVNYANGDGRQNFSYEVDFEKELSFGYFTADGNTLREGLQSEVARGNLKSKKFEPISRGNWFEVLSTSPAEPGLASLQPIPMNTNREQVLAERKKPITSRWNGLQYRKDMLSAGGWSDLHPTEVLKASGCKRVAYITRQDGETVFGQQVFIRLTGSQAKIPFWQKIGDNNNTGWKVEGDTVATPWNRLYNYGNPSSSFNKALRSADITYCTNWNRYSPFQGESAEMIEESYGAPVFIKSGVPIEFQVNKGDTTPSQKNYPGCIPMGSSQGDQSEGQRQVGNTAL